MRMFLAVIPPQAAIEDLEEFLAPRREAVPLRWTSPEQWHLTLAFSADVPDRSYDDLVDRMVRAARKRSPIGRDQRPWPLAFTEPRDARDDRGL